MRKRFIGRATGWVVAAVFSLGITGEARADEADDPDGVEEEEEVRVIQRNRRVRPVQVREEADPDRSSMAGDVLSFEEYANRPYPPMTYIGAQALGMEPDFVHEVQQGMEMLFLRDYNGARKHFGEVDARYPGSALAAVADTLVWQALMLENFDFQYENQYRVSYRNAREGLEKALAEPGNEAWEHMLLGGIIGIDAIHSMRRTNYLSALQHAFSAMDHISKARQAAPEFRDLMLADGMYNYWRSVVTLSSNLLPDFEDRREEGIQQMLDVQRAATFMQPLATLSLAFAWTEEKDWRRAINSCNRNRRAYPDNIINNLVTATTHVSMKNHSSALEVLDDVVRVDPKNKRARYWMGLAHLRSGDLPKAEAEFKAYLASDYLEDYQRANAFFRLGQAYNRQKNHAEAFEAFKAAHDANKHKAAKDAMDRMRKNRRQGKISF